MISYTSLWPKFCWHAGPAGVILGNLADGWGHSGWVWLACRPEAVLTLEPTNTLPDMDATLHRWLADVPTDRDPALPFHGGVFGVLGYDFARLCDPAMAAVRPHPHWPTAQFARFQTVCGLYLPTGRLVVIDRDTHRTRQLHQLWQGLQHAPLPELSPLPSLPDAPELDGYTPSLTDTGFIDAVTQAQAAIRRGEVYQANLSIAWQRPVTLTDPLVLYWHSVRQNPSPFAAYWHLENRMMVCNSPERLVCQTAEGKVISRPIAGTRGPMPTAEGSRDLAAQLLNNPKELAEHAMLVDLQRNDLGRVCVPGSVRVPEWLTVESYSHVTHLVSEVSGQARPGLDWAELWQAVFPGGTITGCPKIRCVQLIDRLEPVPRGWYTGSLGWIDAVTGANDWNILIRSLWLEPTTTPPPLRGRLAGVCGSLVSGGWGMTQTEALQATPPDGLRYNATVQAGAGIVLDSVPAHEVRECRRKAALLIGVLNHHDHS